MTGSISTEVAITNNGTTPLTIRPMDVHLLTRFGMPLPISGRGAECNGRDGETVTLAPGETCALLARFWEQPDEVELKWLTWILPVRRGARSGALAVRFLRTSEYRRATMRWSRWPRVSCRRYSCSSRGKPRALPW